MMHPATVAHICGMLNIARNAMKTHVALMDNVLDSIESAIVADKGGYADTLANKKSRNDASGDGSETHYLDDTAEDALGKLMEQHLKEAVKNDDINQL